MQKIIHSIDYSPISNLINEIELFYAYTSEKTLHGQSALVKPTFDNAFKPLQSLFNEYGDNSYNFRFIDKKYEELKLPEYNSLNIIVCFSGGKDSTALAYLLKNSGYNVYLYHVKGINKAYPDEWKRAKEIANYLELPIYFDTIKFQGKLDFPEHPMKNMIIANNAIRYGITNNIGIQIATGNFLDGEIAHGIFYTSGDDMPEVWDVYEHIMQKIIPQFHMTFMLADTNETLEILMKDKQLLELTQSCVGAQRFRQWNHDNNEKKYGVKLLKNRCGSCWKCALEYIYLADHDKQEYNEGYYRHCLDVLKKSAKRDFEEDFTTWKNLWESYFLYDISQSKYLGG